MKTALAAVACRSLWAILCLGGLCGSHAAEAQGVAGITPRAAARSPEVWREERRIVDVHMHIEPLPERLEQAVRIMDRAGVGLGVVLGAGTVTRIDGQPSDFEVARSLAERLFPGRFLHSMLLDYSGWDEPDFSERAVRQIEAGHAMGAAGLKEFKRLGLFLKDGKGKLIKVDDPKLDPVWKRCGELGMPVSIHVGDPKAFWLPYDESNERWTELKDHRSWWFGDAQEHPPRMELLEALDRVVARHPKTMFIGVHFANNAEDLDWVHERFTERPNFYADIAARVPEIGRHEHERVRRLFTEHRDRILFATDLQVFGKLVLGSGGDAERPTEADAETFFAKHWRWLETADRDWPHMTPIQGDWTIDSIELPPDVLRKVYFDNARRVFARSLPLPTLTAVACEETVVIDGVLDEPVWARATPVRLEYDSADSEAHPSLSTPVRAAWSEEGLMLAYECPYTVLRTFEPTQRDERIGLWENDVVEAFIDSDPSTQASYVEFEWAPSGEFLDLTLDGATKDFDWSSDAESAVEVDDRAGVWRVETRIPWAALTASPPTPGSRWRINLFRHDTAHRVGLAFSPALGRSFHVPERFGWLEFEGPEKP
jgi:predicted TIM-barrel fold metal-dependent hydrolase